MAKDSKSAKPKTPRLQTQTDLSGNADTWLANAQAEKDSWWTDWRTWLVDHSGERQPAPAKLGNKRHPAGVKAPGTYVMQA